MIDDPTARLNHSLRARYRIERELGEGGMATVYLADDLKHQRRVALKVLKPELAAVIGAERFLVEIRTTANLQHPHILPLFDSGEVDGTVFYAMPWIDGESVRDRLRAMKQLRVDEAVGIAKDVADALDHAHRKGIVHRDIKPENILLQDGRALVADFGIALAVQGVDHGRMTETGLSLGTPSYMSPEQALGEKDIDGRADIYALGATLYEMLAGEPPFTGPSAQSIIARVLTEPPRPLTTVRPSVPAAVDAAVAEALEKLPADRHATAADFARALTRESAQLKAPQAAPAGRHSALVLRYAGLTVGAAALMALGYLFGAQGSPESPVTGPSRLYLDTPGLGATGGGGSLRDLALTPDGRSVIHLFVNESGDNRIGIQSLVDAVRRDLGLEQEADQNLGNPRVSPDGRTLVLSDRGGRLLRYSLLGGAPEPSPPVRASPFFAFGSSNELWVTLLDQPSTLVRLEPDGSVSDSLALAAPFAIQQVLDGGRWALGVERLIGGVGPVVVLDLRSNEVRPLHDELVAEARVTGSHLVWVTSNGEMQAAGIDVSVMTVHGVPETVATDVGVTASNVAQFATATNGTIAYVPRAPRPLVLVDRAGAVQPLSAEGGHAPQFSPDGRRIAVDRTTGGGSRDVWVFDLAARTLTRATFRDDGHDVAWTPDGDRISFLGSRELERPAGAGVERVATTFLAVPGSTSEAQPILSDARLTYSGLWLDRERMLTVFTDLNADSGFDIGLVSRDGEVQPLATSRYSESNPAPSPDGGWFALVSDQSGQSEVYARPVAGGVNATLHPISQGGGDEPVWSRTGLEVFYRTPGPDGQTYLMAARVQTEPSFEVLEHQTLFPVSDMAATQFHANYDASPDGQTFVMMHRSVGTRIMILQDLPGLIQEGSGSTLGR